MSPIDTIHAQFSANGVDFAEALEHHYRRGFVFSTPQYFVMGRPVLKGHKGDAQHIADIRNPAFSWEVYDSWWIHAAAGDTKRMWDVLPWPLGFIGFERFDGEPRFYRTEDLRRLTVPVSELQHEPSHVS